MSDNALNNPSNTPEDLRATEARLERLGHMERASVRPGFEDRLVAATAGHLKGLEADAPVVLATIRPSRARVFRLAASIAVVGAGVIGSVWLAGRGTTPVNPPQELAANDSIETDLASVNSELASLMTEGENSVAVSDEFSALESELAALETELSDFGWDEFDGLLEESL